jgi:hypothetical protein
MRARLVALLAAAALVLPACSTLERGRAADVGDGPLTVVLFDVSRSTDDPAIRARYADAFARVLQATADAHGAVVGDVIDDNPLAHSTYPIDATFAPCDPLTDNQLTCEARAKQQTDAAQAAAATILARPAGPSGTDIAAGVRLAERVFASYPNASPKSLVVLSDMAQHTASHDTEPPPNLAGVEVYVVGAGVSAGGVQPSQRIVAIERSWLAYCAAAGADLPEERYGAALIRFP